MQDNHDNNEQELVDTVPEGIDLDVSMQHDHNNNDPEHMDTVFGGINYMALDYILC